jgi:hypothetical protein
MACSARIRWRRSCPVKVDPFLAGADTQHGHRRISKLTTTFVDASGVEGSGSMATD